MGRSRRVGVIAAQSFINVSFGTQGLAKSTGNVWEDRLVDLRIADHAEPIKEMGRLLKVTVHMNT